MMHQVHTGMVEGTAQATWTPNLTVSGGATGDLSFAVSFSDLLKTRASIETPSADAVTAQAKPANAGRKVEGFGEKPAPESKSGSTSEDASTGPMASKAPGSDGPLSLNAPLAFLPSKRATAGAEVEPQEQPAAPLAAVAAAKQAWSKVASSSPHPAFRTSANPAPVLGNKPEPNRPEMQVPAVTRKRPDVVPTREVEALASTASHGTDTRTNPLHVGGTTLAGKSASAAATEHPSLADNPPALPPSVLVQAAAAQAVPTHFVPLPPQVDRAPAGSGKQLDAGEKTSVKSTLKPAAGAGTKVDAVHETPSAFPLVASTEPGGHESIHEVLHAVTHEPAQLPAATSGAAVSIAPGVTPAATNTAPLALRGEMTRHPEANLQMAEGAPGISEPRTLVASANVLEVGIGGGSHGWLRVRAELGHTGEVTASLVASSAGSATALTKQLGAMTEFLRSESVGVTSLAVTAPERHSAMQGAATESGSASDGGQGSGRESRRDARGFAVKPEPAQAWDEMALASWPAGLSLPTSGGGWLSVRV